jgi:hypothetical protein
MAKRERRWVRVEKLSDHEKAAVKAACEQPIAQTLEPRYLAGTHLSGLSAPIDIVGKWRGSKHSFVARYRSDDPEVLEPELDEPFARLGHMEEYWSEARFDVMWLRHTGEWWRLHPTVTLGEALQHVESDPLPRPVIV